MGCDRGILERALRVLGGEEVARTEAQDQVIAQLKKVVSKSQEDDVDGITAVKFVWEEREREARERLGK